MATLFIHVSDNLVLIYIVVGVVCTVLALLVAAILYLIRAKQSKGKETNGRGEAAPDPLFTHLEHLGMLLQLLPKGEDRAELTGLVSGKPLPVCCYVPTAARVKPACCSLYLKYLTLPCSSCPLPGALLP